MSDIKQTIQQILRAHPKAKMTSSGKRTMDKQLYFVIQRPRQYRITMNAFTKHFGISYAELPTTVDKLSKEQDQWLRARIRQLSRSGVGFQHLSGHAIDISVRDLSIKEKKLLYKDLKNKSLHIILEKVAGKQTKYGVSIEQANVFHVDLLQITQSQKAKSKGIWV